MHHRTNDERADHAEHTVSYYADMPGASDETAGLITDLIADLLHLADREGLNITDLLERAHDHYEAEVRGEGDR